MSKIDYQQPKPHKMTRKGTKPNDSKKPAIPGTGKNRPAKNYNPVTKTWNKPD